MASMADCELGLFINKLAGQIGRRILSAMTSSRMRAQWIYHARNIITPSCCEVCACASYYLFKVLNKCFPPWPLMHGNAHPCSCQSVCYAIKREILDH